MGIGQRRAAIAAGLGLLLSGVALADPLSDILKKDDGGACYSRVYDKAHIDKHPGQKTSEVMLSLHDESDNEGAVIRVMLRLGKQANYIVGGCTWVAKANLDIQDKPIIAAFKGPSGLNCYALTSEDGSSAEEGGDFPIDLKDGKSILLYFPEYIAAWPSFDRGSAAKFLELGGEDRVFRLDKTDTAACGELEYRLRWLL